ncbi:AraC family transcriptional regulator [Isoalcanivorax pacificus W11-5]|uniref:AraC family transcriptional regulator n=1 Tax=Isoalcanivorax pacificus W11-5 TaxID=391936 RepID=A0A0B4XKR3_9GAMM|nr:AraC family transcriptional regulator [Isoalcanivorax pacificus]AJD47275.1 AraC family transcriptional regulator [Isoalcanivorax pacificus W11-5]
MHYFARSGGMQGFDALVRELGGDPQALLRAAGLPAGLFANPDLYVDYMALARLTTLAAERCQAPDFGVRLGLRQGLEVLGPLASFLCLQATIGDALQLLVRHMDFHAHGVVLTTLLEGGDVVFRLGFAFEDDVECGQLGALSVLQVLQGLRQVQPEPLPPRNLTLCLPLDEALLRHHTGLASPITTGAPCNSLRFPAPLLSRPVAVSEALRARLTQQWRVEYGDSGLAAQVGRVMMALLPTGECSLAQVAAMIGLHPRTLQQRLKQEQRPYGALLRDTRYALACQYLDRTDMGVTTLALNLGYEDIAAFSRAFRRWTGQSPSDWRQARREG